MFVFSEQHSWQLSDAVQQVLVFSSDDMRDIFEKQMADRAADHISLGGGLDTLQDSNAGAVYKVRAVKNVWDKWLACIRCGVTGELLYDGHIAHNTVKEAFTEAFSELTTSITTSIQTEILKHK